jgi:hypothetical protein
VTARRSSTPQKRKGHVLRVLEYVTNNRNAERGEETRGRLTVRAKVMLRGLPSVSIYISAATGHSLPTYLAKGKGRRGNQPQPLRFPHPTTFSSANMVSRLLLGRIGIQSASRLFGGHRGFSGGEALRRYIPPAGDRSVCGNAYVPRTKTDDIGRTVSSFSSCRFNSNPRIVECR